MRASLIAISSLLVSIDKDEVGKPAHVLDAAERTVELVALALQRQPLLLGVALRLVGAEHLLERAQPLDRIGDGFPVGQRAAEPARIDVILRRPLGGLGDRVLRLTLGADEQDASALRHGIADRLQGTVQHRHRQREIDDVDVVAGAEDVLGHLRIPTVGLMAEMHASFQKLAHAEVWQRHSHFLRLIRRGPRARPLWGRTPDGGALGQGPRVRLPRLYRVPRPRAQQYLRLDR